MILQSIAVLTAVLLLCISTGCCQFPAVCNTADSLSSKTCCPNDCGGLDRGRCTYITADISSQWDKANITITNILHNAPFAPEKGTADARYLWPTVVFENVCQCVGNYGGIDCMKCDFSWTGSDCSERKMPVIRKSFGRLSENERKRFINATLELKNEMGFWSVIAREPANYSSGIVRLQNVSTYNFFVYIHNYVARDRSCGWINDTQPGVNGLNLVDFAHSGPSFPLWHRRYLLLLEKEFQRIMKNDSFGFPYWQWEENDLSAFAPQYYGVPSNDYTVVVNVSGSVINPEIWNTVCDKAYYHDNLKCSDGWKLCNPEEDLQKRKPLQRGRASSYLPNTVEVKIAIAAPSYDAANSNGDYVRDSPRASFRNRLEGWHKICSAVACTGSTPDGRQHMHNNVHDWVGGHMEITPASVNDPVFNLHHCNVDRILESWMKRFATSSSTSLPAYVPTSGGHPGHNRDDYLVPFLPLITPGKQYKVAEEWGYMYDSLILADIPDSSIPDCNKVIHGTSCPICDANSTCIDCIQSQTCPAQSIVQTAPIEHAKNELIVQLYLELSLGTRLTLLIALITIVGLFVGLFKLKSRASSAAIKEKIVI